MQLIKRTIAIINLTMETSNIRTIYKRMEIGTEKKNFVIKKDK